MRKLEDSPMDKRVVFCGQGELPDWLAEHSLPKTMPDLAVAFSETNFFEKLGHNITELRESTGKNKTEFAQDCGLARVHLGRLENGKVSNSTIKSLVAIADAAGKSVEISFLQDTNEASSNLGAIFSKSTLVNLGQNITELRESTGKNKTEFAQECGLTRVHLGRLEKGNDENPSINNLGMMANAAGKVLQVRFVDIDAQTLG